MKELLMKIKFDPFYLVLILACIAGTSFAVFIFKTARPQAIKLIRWSPAESYADVFESFSKRQHPLFKDTDKMIFWGLEKIDSHAEEVIQAINKVTQMQTEQTEYNPAEFAAEDTAKLSEIAHPTQLQFKNPNVPAGSKRRQSPLKLHVIVEVYNFVNMSDINVDEFYDPKSLKKAFRKYPESPTFFTMYQKSSDKFYIDIIQFKEL